MKLSVSLPEEDVIFLNDYAEAHALSRSAAVHEAIRGLRGELGGAVGETWDEWDTADDGQY
jgi:hypothetical protein